MAGLVYNPASADELFTAERGKGAFTQRSARLRVASSKQLSDAVVAARSHTPAMATVELTTQRKDLAVQDKVRRAAPLRSGRARPRPGRGWALRRLLGTQPLAVGHGGPDRAGARGRAVSSPGSRRV